MRNTAYRRHQTEKRKASVKRLWGMELDEKWLHIMINTRKPCSCIWCGNPRKWFGEKTRQEKIADINENDIMYEIHVYGWHEKWLDT